ncbi:FAD binding domain-containing protein [Megalodesulfovibrio gigas]|uniref:Putative aerobic-type carbon monoxide dehydrogenase, middle subunit CoxM/CutM-like protein n=1 Tax=Megalodesulfovibrio gigas (strain ATCC 19364 / DSM 1382 / NCIMB 9332 / VKM B-1759) TaxID=1121448 RepID=T2GFA0_MEGG1|nr:xanthine dehydrogenase family protein subunit M [Megalodesulfovibrio gigas]AGW14859.1 putative aerobic-type carbon monoxide dehydrogenase, middle subunit CoxM/CutM-like protein [Megalodesulfovibrio gigas DSM 1382 = ATCC 19364]
MFEDFAYTRPDTVAQAAQLLQEEAAHALAGGSDLLGCLRERIFPVKTVVSLSNLKDLRGIARTAEGGLALGARTTIAEVVESTEVQTLYPGLAQAAAEVASPQLRNQGTLGGNLCQKPRCWYYRGDFDCLRKGGASCLAVHGENQLHCILGGDACYMVHPSDTAPMLQALDATVWVAGPAGDRSLPLEQLFMPPGQDPTRETTLQPGELVTHIHLPPPEPGLHTRYRKVRARRSWDFALAGMALAAVTEDEVMRSCRIVLSGAAPIPWRVTHAETVLTGQRLTRALCRAAAEAAMQGAEPLAHNAYKIELFRNMIQEELERLIRS